MRAIRNSVWWPIAFWGVAAALVPAPAQGFCQTVAPTGLPLTFVIDDVLLDGTRVGPDWQICILDLEQGDLPVGSAVTSSFPRVVTVWQGDPSVPLPGAVCGHTIAYEIFDPATQTVYASPVNVAYLAGDGLFCGEPYTRVRLEYETEAFCPVVSPTGLPLTFVVQHVWIGWDLAQAGDVLCIHDLDQNGLAVGTAVLQQAGPAVVTAWEGSADPLLPGATCGHRVGFSLQQAGTGTVYPSPAEEVYVIGDGFFCGEPYTVLDLHFHDSSSIEQHAAARDPHTAIRHARYDPAIQEVRIAFDVQRAGMIELRICDLQGRTLQTVASGYYEAGSHEITWDGSASGQRAVPRGIYFARLADAQDATTRKFFYW